MLSVDNVTLEDETILFISKNLYLQHPLKSQNESTFSGI